MEFLPSETEIDDRRQRNQGLTRPEIAVILSYAKIDLYNGLEACGESLADFLTMDPQRYFPATLRKRYADLIPTHPLSREILATLIANTIVNRMGPAFVQRLQQDTGASTVTIARSYVVARELCQASEIWQNIEALDNQIAASMQQSMMFEVSRILRHTCYWLIDRFGESIDIVKTVHRLNDHMATLYNKSQSIVIGPAKDRQRTVIEDTVREGVPEKLSRRMAGLLLTRGGLDIADLSQSYRKDTLETAEMYSEMTDRLGIIWLSRSVENLRVRGRWQAMARSNLRQEFYELRRDLAERLMKKRGKGTLSQHFSRWLTTNAAGVSKFDAMLDDMKLRQQGDFAALSVAAQELRKLIDT